MLEGCAKFRGTRPPSSRLGRKAPMSEATNIIAREQSMGMDGGNGKPCEDVRIEFFLASTLNKILYGRRFLCH